ncbi:MAG: hypothetical protein HFG29_09645 [Eubacterium sp.]|nr:hypothetical protein [Eubacterium sp.]
MNKKLFCLFMNFVLIFSVSIYANDNNLNGFGDDLLLEQDDFSSQEEYEDYLDEHPEVEPQQYTEIPDSQSMVRATSGSTGTATATLEYTIVGLPSNNAIQKTYITSKYVYVLQKVGSDSYLSRCVISGTRANYQDCMVLKRFGHTQTLEMFQNNGKEYFWVGCKANEKYEDYKWATQLARIQYSPRSDIDYTEVYRFSSLSYANGDGISIGTIKRADAALSSNGKKLFLWVQDDTGEIQYSYYDAGVLNAKLDALEKNGGSKYIAFTNADIKKACYGSFRQSGSNRVLPNGSCQGVEFNDADNIFIIGGNQNEAPKIAKLTGSKSNYTFSKLVTVTNSNLGVGAYAETEGIQLKGDYIYFGIYYKNKTDPGRWQIYKILKSAF